MDINNQNLQSEPNVPGLKKSARVFGPVVLTLVFLAGFIAYSLLGPLVTGQDLGLGEAVGLGILLYYGIPATFVISLLVFILLPIKTQTAYRKTLGIMVGLIVVFFGILTVSDKINSDRVAKQIQESNQQYTQSMQVAQSATDFSQCNTVTSNLSAWSDCVVRTVTTSESAQTCSQYVQNNPTKFVKAKDFYNYALVHCQIISGQQTNSAQPCNLLRNQHDDSEYFYNVCQQFIQNSTSVEKVFFAPKQK